MSKRFWIRLVGDHPHAGEVGHVDTDDEGKTTAIELGGGVKMWPVALYNCIHGDSDTYACFENMTKSVDPATWRQSPRSGSRRGRRT